MPEEGTFRVASAYVALGLQENDFSDQIAAQIEEGVSAGADAAGQALVERLGAAAGKAGETASEMLVEALSSSGDIAANQIGDSLTTGLAKASDQAGGVLAEGLTAGLQTAVSEVDDASAEMSSSLVDELGAGGRTAAQEQLEQISAALAAGTEEMDQHAQQLMAQLAQVGTEGGYAFATNFAASQGAALSSVGIGAAAASTGLAGLISRALGAGLVDAATEVGQSAGDALIAGMSSAAAQSSGIAAVRIGAAMSSSLDTTMTAAGAGAGSAFGAGFTQAQQQEGPGGVVTQSLKSEEQLTEQEAEALGQKAAIKFGSAWEGRYGTIPRGSDISDILAMANQQNQQADVFIPNLAESQGSWILASKTGAKEAADAAWEAYGDELAELVIPPERFEKLTDSGIELWTAEVRAQAAVSGEGFVNAFADAITMGMVGLDWESLTRAQSEALLGAMKGTLGSGVAEEGEQIMATLEQSETQAVARLEAMVQSTGNEVADALIAKIVEARQAAIDQLVELAVEAADEGAEAGGRFATFFNQAVDGIRLVVARDPEKVAAAGAEAGREYANAMVDELEAQLSKLPEAAAEEGEASASEYVRFFTGGLSQTLAIFAKDPAKAAGAGAGEEFADAMMEQLQARLAALGEAGGEEFGQLVEQQLEVQLQLAAAQATAAYEQELEDGLAAAQSEALAQVSQMRTDINLDRMFANLTQTLPAEFVDAFSQMRQQIALTEEEFAQFSDSGQQQLRALATLLQGQDVQAADQFMEALSTKAFNQRLDPASLMAGAGTEAEGLASGLGKVEKAAAGATSGMGGMASMMYGPWGMAAFAVMSLLPMMGGAFSALENVIEPTKAVLLDTAGLASAIATDAGAAGDATAAFVAQASVTDGMAASAQRAGVSLATWTEAAIGNATAQAQVTSSVDALNKVQMQQQLTTDETAKTTGKYSGELQDARTSATIAAQTTGELTDANQKLLNSMHAEAEQVAAAITNQTNLTQATLTLDQQTDIYEASVRALGEAQLLQVQQTKMQNDATAQFGSQILFAESSVSYMNAAMGAAVATNRESALTSAYASVALLGLGTSQSELNAQLSAGETLYTEATAGSGAYGAALTSLNGTTNQLLSSEASFTTTLDSLTTAVKTNGNSLDINSAKGAANVTVMTQIATAAQAAAVAVYQNDVQTGNASRAYEDANNKLAEEKNAFEQAAEKAGFHKSAVQALANELFKLPANITTTVNVDTSQATSAINNLLNQYSLLNFAGTNATAQEVAIVKEQATHRATGGPVQAGNAYIVGEERQEMFVPDRDGYIYPSVGAGQRAVAAHNARIAGASAAGGIKVDQHFYGSSLPNIEQQANMRRELASLVGV